MVIIGIHPDSSVYKDFGDVEVIKRKMNRHASASFLERCHGRTAFWDRG
jgi:hypothetical protein